MPYCVIAHQCAIINQKSGWGVQLQRKRLEQLHANVHASKESVTGGKNGRKNLHVEAPRDVSFLSIPAMVPVEL